AGVSAIGDLVGPLLLAHTASEQGVLAVEAMVQPREGAQGLDVTRVPMCVYCQPEVAAVGLTEAEARSRGEGQVGGVPVRAPGKAMGAGPTAGVRQDVAGARYGGNLRAPLSGHG